MKSLTSLTVALVSLLTLPGCVDLAGLDVGGYGGGGGGGGRPYDNGGYSNGYQSNSYGQYHEAPRYNNGPYYPPQQYNHSHDYDDHNHGSSGNSNYFGGPAEWYKSGQGLGKRDRKEHLSCNYRRHSNQYDKKTESQFARGYEDGYSR